MKLVPALVLLAACHPGAGDDFEIKPPGGDNQTVLPGVHDAALPDGDDASLTIPGRVCFLVDLRNLSACSTTAAGGLTVTLGGETAITAADGTFVIPAPLGSNLVFRVVGNTIVPSVMQFGAIPTIPALSAVVHEQILAANKIAPLPGQGSAVVRIVRGGVALPGVRVVGTPSPAFGPFFDGSDPLIFEQLVTGPAGIAFLPGARIGAGVNGLTIAATLDPLDSPASMLVDIEDQAMTFATLVMP
jgi:hypothetical protein